MKTPLGTESVSLLLDSVDEAESVASYQLKKHSAFFFYTNALKHTTHGFHRDPSRMFGFTHTSEHTLKANQLDGEAPALVQLDARTGDELVFPSPKWIAIYKSVGSQACLDVIPGSQVGAPGVSHTIQAYGNDSATGVGNTRGVRINRYKGDHGKHGVGLRVKHDYSHGTIYGKTIVDFTPDLELVSVESQYDTSRIEDWPYIRWNAYDCDMPEQIATIVGNVASNILSLAQAAEER